jgi:hypothetical protein
MWRDWEFCPEMKGEIGRFSKKKLSGRRSLLITWAKAAAGSAKQQTSNHLNGIQGGAGRGNIHRAGPRRALKTAAHPLQFLYLFCYSYPV